MHANRALTTAFGTLPETNNAQTSSAAAPTASRQMSDSPQQTTEPSQQAPIAPGTSNPTAWVRDIICSCFPAASKKTAADKKQLANSEDWQQFFDHHFSDPGFTTLDENHQIDVSGSSVFTAKKTRFLNELEKNLHGNPLIHLSFQSLPEGRADQLTDAWHIRMPGSVVPKHIASALTRLTFNQVNLCLRQEAAEITNNQNTRKKAVSRVIHIDFGKRPESELQPFSMPISDLSNAMAHFGTLLPTHAVPGLAPVPGVKAVYADLSGLRIRSLDDQMTLQNMVIRSIITRLHLDLQDRVADSAKTTWTSLLKMLTLATMEKKYLEHLDIDIAVENGGLASFLMHEIASEFKKPECRLLSLGLNGGKWDEQARACLAEVVSTRTKMGQPLVITINGQVLSAPAAD